MKIKKLYIILLAAMFAASGCGGKSIKPSADSLVTTEALRVTNVIKDAYEGKDVRILRENISPEFEKNVTEGLFFEKAELLFAPRIVKIAGPDVRVNLNWQGTWTIKGKTIKNRGVATFVFQQRTMKLTGIEGDNPFLIIAYE
ncbi:MAG: hypothetical protein HY756_10655 [Nitrospirae bacterium]|nr:hypothetical protein [Nitrospirota bacterium]